MCSMQKSHCWKSSRRAWLWFVGLYLASLLVYAAVTYLMHLLIRI